VQPLVQQMAMLPAKFALHFVASGFGPRVPATSRPRQSPSPSGCHPLGAGAGMGVGAAAAQVYIWPGFAPPVHEPVAMFLYVQPFAQHTAVRPEKVASHLAASGTTPRDPATSRPGQSPTPTGCQVPAWAVLMHIQAPKVNRQHPIHRVRRETATCIVIIKLPRK